jgi:esterase/lipase superfamily enzyme
LLRVAQIAAATGYQGRVYLFSWPSQESRLAYIGDMDYAEQAEIDLEYFLNAILRDADSL